MSDIIIKMPKLSEAMSEGLVLRWYVKPGDFVSPGDLIAEVETDKANMEIEATDAGVVAELFVPPGERVPVGSPLARLVSSAEELAGDVPVSSDVINVPSVASEIAEVDNREPITGRLSALEQGRNPSPVTPAQNVSPLALVAAQELNVDLQHVKGSGPGGRIMRDDVYAAAGLQKFSDGERGESATETVNWAELTRDVLRENGNESEGNVASESVQLVGTVRTVVLSGTVEANSILKSLEIVIGWLNVLPPLSAAELLPIVVGRALALAWLNYSDGENGGWAAKDVGCVAIGLSRGNTRVYPVIYGVHERPLSELIRDFLQVREKALSGNLTCEECERKQFVVENFYSLGIFAPAALLDEYDPPRLFIGCANSALLSLSLCLPSRLDDICSMSERWAKFLQILALPLLLADNFTPVRS